MAATGYAALRRSASWGLVAVHGRGWPPTAVLFLDRLGKGIRTAPRDALISLRSERAEPGRFVRRPPGARHGRRLARPARRLRSSSAWPPGAYNSVFLVCFSWRCSALGVLILFVENPPQSRARRRREPPAPKSHVTLRSALGLFRITRFRLIALVGSGLRLLTMSDAFLYLVFQRHSHLTSSPFPLLFLGTALAYLCFAVPSAGSPTASARLPSSSPGTSALLGFYLVLRFADLSFLTVVVLAPALRLTTRPPTACSWPSRARPSPSACARAASASSPPAPRRRASCRSVVFGAIWVAWGPQAAMLVFLVGLAVMLPAAALALRTHPEAAPA